MDFSIIAYAGVSQAQFAELVGVSRVTVNTWVMGRFSPRPSLRNRISKALRLLDEAVAEGTLPVPVTSHNAATAERLAILSKSLTSEG